MNFDYTPKVEDLRQRVGAFMEAHVYRAEAEYFASVNSGDNRWLIPPVMEKLKELARQQGLWNLFLPSITTIAQNGQ